MSNGNVVQRHGVTVSTCNLLPALVKHCVLTNAELACGASRMNRASISFCPPHLPDPQNRSKPGLRSRLTGIGLFAAFLCFVLAGCTTTAKRCPVTSRAFDFQTDTFAFSNQLAWTYSFSTNGEVSTHKRVPKPDYSLHCFPMTRAAERFFLNARFDPAQPPAGDLAYRGLIRAVLHGHAITVIPGYANLREFSAAKEALLKAECGGIWRSYFQRGNWRLVFPLTRAHQEHTARQLQMALQDHRLPIIHLAKFPQLTINHAVLLYDAIESEHEVRFLAYDPNITGGPVALTYDRAKRTFLWPRSHYFAGGRVDVYQIYHKWNY